MKKRVSLNGCWDLTWAEGLPLLPAKNYGHGKVKGRHYLQAQVPEATIKTLQREKIINDPNVGINSLSATWIDNVFWIYYKEFNVEHEDIHKKAILHFKRKQTLTHLRLAMLY